jgi:hypothetical protein
MTCPTRRGLGTHSGTRHHERHQKPEAASDTTAGDTAADLDGRYKPVPLGSVRAAS